MKILIVNENDSHGGAARAAYRLHRALRNKDGIESQMLVQRKFSDDTTTIEPETNLQRRMGKVRPFLDSLPLKIYKQRDGTLFSPSWVPFGHFSEKINNHHPDIVHLHWIAGGMMRIEELIKIEAPIIWSLHDNWAFTGGCHIKRNCSEFMRECGCCPVLGSNNPNDLSRRHFRRKQKTYNSMKKFTIIGLSRWIADEARRSPLLTEQEVVCLPNPIDIDDYRPIEKTKAREIMRLPIDKKIIGFGAMDPLSDINKGYRLLREGLNKIECKENIELVVFGSSKSRETHDFPYKTNYLGRLSDDVSLCLLYSACDVVIVPSFQEAFGQTASEAMACGTPVVAFAVTGLLDIVDHKQNGYLAKAYDSVDLAKGIDWILEYTNQEALSKEAREKVLREFGSGSVADKYVGLYRQVLEGNRVKKKGSSLFGVGESFLY